MSSRRQRLPLDFDNPPLRDGLALHTSIPSEYWCVTDTDLHQFAQLIRRRVTEGRITETDMDPFITSDPKRVYGPSVHTVNADVIKPVTAKAGNVSWALMLHPTGLRCDLFITHCWREGIYEFIRKVLHSWPRNARHAYCCMLSNPQNLDIGGLVEAPKDSPFAHALHCSSFMLVVPNHHCSIYSRIWCAYEAFYAYKHEKFIMTAIAPIRHLHWHIAPVIAVEVVALAASAEFFMHFDVGGEHPYYPYKGLDNGAQLLFGNILMMFSFLCFAISPYLHPRAKIVYYQLLFGAATSAVWLGMEGWKLVYMLHTPGFQPRQQLTLFLLPCTLCLAAVLGEVDRRRKVQGISERNMLEMDYTGKLRDASATMSGDRDVILQELSASGIEDEANLAIDVLLRSGISTPALRTAARICGRPLGQAALVWDMSTFILVWVTVWLVPASNHIASEVDVYYMQEQRENDLEVWPILLEDIAIRVSLFGLIQGLAWPVIFTRLSLDKRGFANAAMVRILTVTVCFFIMVPFFLGVVPSANPIGMSVYYLLVTPLVLILAVAGPALTAKIPWLGPRLVQLLLTRLRCKKCCCCCRRSDAAESADQNQQDASGGHSACQNVSAGQSTVSAGQSTITEATRSSSVSGLSGAALHRNLDSGAEAEIENDETVSVLL